MLKIIRRLNDAGLLAALAYAVALYGLLSRFHFEINREFWERLMDFTHIPLMAILAVITLLAPVFPKRTGLAWRMAATAIFVVVFAGVIEIIQPYFGRTKSLDDFLNGALGTALGLAAVEMWRAPGRLRLVCLLLPLTGAVYGAIPALSEFRGIVWRFWHFPLLADFESSAELSAWRGIDGAELHPSLLNATSGGRSLQVEFQGGNLPGAEFLPGQLDCRGYRSLEFDAFNPGAPFPLVLRVDDDGPHGTVADRAHWSVVLASGRNHVRVPLAELEHAPKSRALHLNAVRRMVFFVLAHNDRHAVFLDSLRLLRATSSPASPAETPAHPPAPASSLQ